jgi:hypothetical protein
MDENTAEYAKKAKQTNSFRADYLKAAESPSLGISAYIPKNWPRGVKNVLSKTRLAHCRIHWPSKEWQRTPSSRIDQS